MRAHHSAGLIVAVVSAIVVQNVDAQNALRTTPAWSYKTNFAIPDAPAFELLEIDPATILRPQSVRELALSLAQFQNATGSFSIPKTVALEFSPGLLIQVRTLTQQEYNTHDYLYAIRVSVAARQDEATSANRNLAVGLRFTLADESLLKNDEAYPAELAVTGLTQQALETYRNALDRQTKEARTRGEDPSAIELALNEQEQAALAVIEKQIRARWAERYWNADRWEVAVAARGSSADSTGRDPKLDAVSLWMTASKGWGTWGLGLFGVRAGSRRESIAAPFKQESVVAGRFYFGHNTIKAYGEGQQTWRDEVRPKLLLNSGVELAVSDWLWLDFGAGVERVGSDRGYTVTSFKLKTTVPGL